MWISQTFCIYGQVGAINRFSVSLLTKKLHFESYWMHDISIKTYLGSGIWNSVCWCNLTEEHCRVMWGFVSLVVFFNSWCFPTLWQTPCVGLAKVNVLTLVQVGHSELGWPNTLWNNFTQVFDHALTFEWPITAALCFCQLPNAGRIERTNSFWIKHSVWSSIIEVF